MELTAAPRLRLVFWETTQACNLACKHCRASAVGWRDPNELSTAEACAMMDSFAALGNPVLVFSGGEPLMRPDIFELMDQASQRGIPFALSTNGTLVDADMADRIAAAAPHRVSVSLDGPDAATHDAFRQSPGAFDATLGAIRLLRERGVEVQVNTSATRHNGHLLAATLDLAQREGCCAWHLFMLVPVGCGMDIPEADRLQAGAYEATLKWFVEQQAVRPLEMKATCAPHVTRVARQWVRRQEHAGTAIPAAHGGQAGAHPSAGAGKGCLAGTGICFVSRFGKVQGCGYMPVEAGNLRQQPLSQIWAGSPFFNALRDPANLKGKCGACEFASSCFGCRARAYSKTGDAFAEEPLCNYIPAALRGAQEAPLV